MKGLVSTMMTVHDVMTKTVTAVHPETSLKDVARMLVVGGISGLPVVDEGGHVVGVVSEADLLIKEQGVGALPRRRGARVRGESKAMKDGLAKVNAVTAGEAMTSPAITIDPDASLPAAAAIMVDRAVNRLPVTSNGVLVGIVTRADLVRAYVRSDEQLAETIRYDVLLRHLLVNPVLFEVTVTEGVVQISGRAETRSIAEMIERLVAAVPGVIAVRADLTWAFDDSRYEAPERDLVSPSTH
jgi:CBS domain-containing protein